MKNLITTDTVLWFFNLLFFFLLEKVWNLLHLKMSTHCSLSSRVTVTSGFLSHQWLSWLTLFLVSSFSINCYVISRFWTCLLWAFKELLGQRLPHYLNALRVKHSIQHGSTVKFVHGWAQEARGSREKEPHYQADVEDGGGGVEMDRFMDV